jgi:hypothetical protein
VDQDVLLVFPTRRALAWYKFVDDGVLTRRYRLILRPSATQFQGPGSLSGVYSQSQHLNIHREYSRINDCNYLLAPYPLKKSMQKVLKDVRGTAPLASLFSDPLTAGHGKGLLWSLCSFVYSCCFDNNSTWMIQFSVASFDTMTVHFC